MPTSFSLLTLNTWKCDGAYAQRMQQLREGLAGLRPDLIALQEAFLTDDGSTSTAGDLAAHLGMHVSLVRARGKRREFNGHAVHSHSCLAVLSRTPIDECWALSLPSPEDDGGRMAQLVRLRAGGLRVMLANLHLTHLSQPALRRQQLQAVLQHLGELGPSDLTLLCGDFNEGLDGPTLAEHREAPWRLQHAFELAGRVAEPTWWDAQGRGHTLDHVFAVPGLCTRAPAVMDARTVLPANRPDAQGITPSDHSGVLVRWAAQA